MIGHLIAFEPSNMYALACMLACLQFTLAEAVLMDHVGASLSGW